MFRLLSRLNYLPIFDTAWWPKREQLSKLFGIAAVVTVLGRMIYINIDFIKACIEWRSTFFVPLYKWAAGIGEPVSLSFGYYDLQMVTLSLSTFIYLAYIISFLTRSDSKYPPRGFMEVVFPFVIAGLPFAFGMFTWDISNWCPATFECAGITITRFGVLFAITCIMGAGALTNLIGLLSLRRAFTIMTDARELVTTGLFRYVRHPLYVGHFLEFFAMMLMALNVYTASLYVVFVVGQYIRARNEEKKLSLVFSGYEEYRRTTGMFFPKLFGTKRTNLEESGNE